MTGILSRERIIAPPDYNRWRVLLASVAIHLCIGSVYAWSICNPPLTRVQGVVTSAADDQLEVLIEQKTVTIARLMEIAPPGTLDPASGLYNSTMVLMASLLAIALISNALMRPVHARHHIVAELDQS